MADNPYDKIGSVVERWCKDHVYAQMLVTISIGYEWEPPHEETHLLDFDAEEGGLVWDSDWWEGQQHIELVGFTPLYKVRLNGEGEYARTIRRGRNIYNTVPEHCEFKCSLCGAELSTVYGGRNDFGMDGGYLKYCPNCGADMREVDK